ncbi:NAD-dependent protein deacetylase Sir2B-like [Aphis craccivora]|uniref:NAD-dependent protein deacetylase Sir2B-like n=1 Tax=Aphis craccivora TaxID=307492 RepID=A0A6G0Y5S8_APHCR|nr:NAD-dependent protein deacetylase Sir2B-like [Aphis craccivora]
MDPSNIAKSLEYDTDFSSEVDDDFLDQDFRISDRENDELDGILAFDTDSDFNENNEIDFLLPEINVIDEISDDEHRPSSPKDEDRISLISIFNNIGDKSKQDTFLGGLIHLKPVSRQRSRNGSRPNKTCSVQYEVRLGINVISVCKKAFCSIFGMGKTAVDRIKYEPDFWAVYNEDREIVTMKPRVKYPYFAKYFASNFNISFAYPRLDTYQTCDQLLKSIQNETNAEEKASLNVEKEVHLRKAQVFYTYLKQLSAEAKENNSIIDVLSFDFQQNMPLSRITSGDVFYKRQLWSYNFCIHSASTGKSYYFMYNQTVARKGQNEFLACDRCFGHIEKARRKVETVFLPEEYEKLVSETNITNKEKEKFTIMAYRYVEYNRNEGLYCGTSGNSTIREHYNMEKNGEILL